MSRGPGTELRHAFSAGPHYDPDNTGLGPLVVHDEIRLEAGAGFPAHRHRAEEVVTVVLEGALRHEDGDRTAVVRAGQVAHLSAGSGVEHAERAEGGPVRLLQARLLSTDDVPPTYAVHDVPVAAGLRVVLDVGPGRLLRGRCPAEVPASPYAHLHVLAGQALLGGELLLPGDAARLTAEGAVQAEGDAELLVWLLDEPGRPD